MTAPKEGFDAYGRRIPPPLPAGKPDLPSENPRKSLDSDTTISLPTLRFSTRIGIDGWGRPMPGPDGQFSFRPPGMMGPGMPGMPQPPGGNPEASAAGAAPAPAPPPPAPVAQPEGEQSADIGVTSDSGRPEE